MFIALGAMASCEKEVQPIAANIIFAEGADATLEFTAEQGAKTITFNSAKAWTAGVEADQTWCAVSPASGEAGAEITLTITASKNESYGARSAKVTIISDGVKKEITATQIQNDSFTFTGAPTAPLPATENTFVITTAENMGTPTVKIADGVEWITVATTPAVKGLSNTTLTFTVEANTTGVERSGKITITSGSKDGDFTVTQPSQNLVINIPDANFKKCLVSNREINTNGDNEISYLEAYVVTTINCGNLEISSLSGIEHFTALRALYCHQNNLTTIDVSKNIALEMLSCYNNKLTTIDVSKNPALLVLDGHDNLLATLDVSKNTALEGLYCNSNNLTTIDVSKHLALEALICNLNQISALDLSNNAKLTILRCNNNRLSTLDVTKNPALTTLYCFNNQLTTLDTSKNLALGVLYCYNNELTTTLDVSKNLALEAFKCANNQLTTLDITKNLKLVSFLCTPMNGTTNKNLLTHIYLTQAQADANNVQSFIDKPDATQLTVQ